MHGFAVVCKNTTAAAVALILAAACGSAAGDDGSERGGDGGTVQPSMDSQPQEPSRVDLIRELTGDAATGAPVFAATCGQSTCHGADGDEGPATNLSQVVARSNRERLITVAVKGSGSMRPLSELSDQQVADVITYVQETF